MGALAEAERRQYKITRDGSRYGARHPAGDQSHTGKHGEIHQLPVPVLVLLVLLVLLRLSAKARRVTGTAPRCALGRRWLRGIAAALAYVSYFFRLFCASASFGSLLCTLFTCTIGIGIDRRGNSLVLSSSSLGSRRVEALDIGGRA